MNIPSLYILCGLFVFTPLNALEDYAVPLAGCAIVAASTPPGLYYMRDYNLYQKRINESKIDIQKFADGPAGEFIEKFSELRPHKKVLQNALSEGLYTKAKHTVSVNTF